MQSLRRGQPNIVSEDGGGDNSCMMAAMDSAPADVPPEFSDNLFVWAVVILGIMHMMSHGERSHDEQLAVHGADSTSLHGAVQHLQSVRRAQKDAQDLLSRTTNSSSIALSTRKCHCWCVGDGAASNVATLP